MSRKSRFLAELAASRAEVAELRVELREVKSTVASLNLQLAMVVPALRHSNDIVGETIERLKDEGEGD